MIVNQQLPKAGLQKAEYGRSLFMLPVITFLLSLGVYSQCLTAIDNRDLARDIEKMVSRKSDLEKTLPKVDKSQSGKLQTEIRNLDSMIRLKQGELDKLLKNRIILKIGETMTWKVENCYRQALVLAPKAGTPNGKHPLVFVFHAHNHTMQDTLEQLKIQATWPEAIVVYPQGLDTPKQGKEEDESGWQKQKDQKAPVGNRDLKLFDTMVAAMRQKFKVDDTQIYAAGFSNGAAFCYLLWAERANVIAAIAEIAGGLNKNESLNTPRPVLAIIGDGDDKNLPANQNATVDRARIADNANGNGQPCEPNKHDEPDINNCTLYHSKTHTPVKVIHHAGGHKIPSWAGTYMVKFFKNHEQL